MNHLVKSVRSREYEYLFISFDGYSLIVYRSSVEAIVAFNHDLLILQHF